MKRTWWISLAACLALCCLTGSEAHAWCIDLVNGKSTIWKTYPVTYFVQDTADAATIAAIDKAFATWAAVKCAKLTFKNGGKFSQCTNKVKTACTGVTTTKNVHFHHGTDYIYIFWTKASTGWPYTDDKGTTQVGTSYASYQYSWFGMQQNITGASISVNAFKYKWNTTGGDSSTLDVQNELTSLIGGVIGLTYSTVSGATMTKQLKFGDTSKQSLHADDIAGLTYLYFNSASGCTKPPAPNASGCSTGGTTTDGGGTTTDGGGTTTDGGGTTKKDTGGSSNNDSGGSSNNDSGGSSTYDSGGGQGCNSNADCPVGYICDVNHTCVPLNSGEEDEGGCGCWMGSRGRLAAPMVLVLLVIGLVLLRRRRR